MSLKQITDFSSFSALDIRVGRIVNIEDAATKKPTYRLTVDFGPGVGIKKSNTELAKQIQNALDNLKKSGLSKQLEQKWLSKQ